MPKSLYFNITDYCNSSCGFCAAEIPILKNLSEIASDNILQIYENYRIGFGDDVVINGGEPTLYPDLEIVIREAKRRGAEVVLFTNGRLLSNQDRAKTWLGAGVTRVSIPLYGRSSATHDTLTRRPGSFSQTLLGIHNAFLLQREFGFPNEIELKVLAVRNSIQEWPYIIELILREFGTPDIFVMSGLNMWSKASRFYKKFLPTQEEIHEFVNAALRRAADNHLPVSFWSIPLCMLSSENLKKFIAPLGQLEIRSSRRVIYFDPMHLGGIEYADDEFSPYQEVEPKCRECNLAKICGPGRVFFQELATNSIVTSR
jgi:MoaA/NifB/PqqE/SkfB family radical SAM enzyme